MKRDHQVGYVPLVGPLPFLESRDFTFRTVKSDTMRVEDGYKTSLLPPHIPHFIPTHLNRHKYTPHSIMSTTFTRLSASFTTLTCLLAAFAIATPQGYQPYRPYDPTFGSGSVAISSSATTSADFASPGAAASIFGNDGAGLDNGVDDNDGTPFGIDTSRGGSGSNDDGEEEEPTPTAPEPISCAGTIQCCSPAGVIISVCLLPFSPRFITH